MPSLKNDMVALEPTCKIIPCRGNEGVFSLKVTDDLVARGLHV